MEDIAMTPLVEFRGKAKLATYISGALTIVFIFFAVGFAASAQSKYSSYLTSNSSLTSTISTTYFRSYQSAKSIADACAAVAAVCGIVAGFSIFAWIGANLHIASFKAQLNTPKAKTASSVESPSFMSAPSVGFEAADKEPEDESCVAEASSNV